MLFQPPPDLPVVLQPQRSGLHQQHFPVDQGLQVGAVVHPLLGRAFEPGLEGAQIARGDLHLADSGQQRGIDRRVATAPQSGDEQQNPPD